MNRPPSVTGLPFRNLPHQPRLFLEYIDGSASVRDFYGHPPALESLHAAAAEISRLPFPRRDVAKILAEQNQAFGCGRPALLAVEHLAEPDSIAVLTGQQVGLFTGPVLAIYKALTALQLCAELRRSGHNAVPIFWMASDDHDLAEVTRIAICEPDSEMRIFDAREELFGAVEMPPYPVGEIILPEAITRVLSRYTSALSGAWRAEIESRIASTYRPGSTLAEAFGRLMARLFADLGLVVFNPRAAQAKQLAAPVIGRALLDAPALHALSVERSRKLSSAGFHPQVTMAKRSTLVFLEEEGQRRLLIMGEDDFIMKQAGRHYSTSEMSALVEAAPERFSPNVLLRPVVQDHLFPTVAYVGGPAEISYFAQVEPLYRHFDRPMPVIWPRTSLTVLDPEVGAVLDRYGLTLEDCFHGHRHVVRRALRARPGRPQTLLADLERNVGGEMDALKSLMQKVDASLGPAADTARRKLIHRIASLETKFMNLELRQNDGLREEVLHVMNGCFPCGNLQEREIGVHHLLARLGPSLMNALYEAVDLRDLHHRILRF